MHTLHLCNRPSQLTATDVLTATFVCDKRGPGVIVSGVWPPIPIDEWQLTMDPNIRGRSGPGLERPGLKKEEEAAAARSGKESMNKSKERWRERTRRTRVGRREKKEKKEKRTMHTDWNIWVADALDWNIRGRSGPGLERPGLQKEEEAMAARNGKENKNDESREPRSEDRKNRIRRGPNSTGAPQDRNNRVIRTGVSREEAAQDWSVRDRRRRRKRRRRETAKTT